jgi:membrane-anchored glycerophosphoryl diester phosphodiesterase (GDPDase)
MSTAGRPPTEPLLRLRPLGLGEILDDIFRVYRRHFGLMCAIALWLSLPSLLVQFTSGTAYTFGVLAAFVGSLGNTQSTQALMSQQPAEPPNLVLVLLSYLITLAVIPFSLGAISQAAIDLAQGKVVSVRSAFAGVARRYWALVAQTLLFIVALLPLLLCLPVAIWLAIRWSVAVPALLAERIGPIQALGRSWRLTRGSWWRQFGILLLVYLLQATVSGTLGILGLPIGFAIPFVPPLVRGAIIVTVYTLAGALSLPVFYLCIVLLYFDLRIRHEHFDLDQLARQAVAPSINP